MDKKEIISKSDFIITLGSMLSDNKEEIRNKIIESIAKKDARLVYMHPIDNIDISLYYTQFIKYEVGSEEGICALLLDTFVNNSEDNVKKYIDSLDLGYISAESSAGEEEFEEAYEQSKECKFKTLVIGDDLIEHKRVENIARLLAIFKKYTDFNLIVLNEDLEKKIEEISLENLEDIADLKSYNGTLLYRLIDEEENDVLICSQTFTNIAKVKNKDKVNILYEDETIQREIKLDKRLSGTIAIAKVTALSDKKIFNNYRYKIVKIQKIKD